MTNQNKPIVACQNCMWSVPFDSLGIKCRRFPPQYAIDNTWERFKFPVVDKNSWCGEFKPK